MRFERRKRHASEVNAGALTDIMFFLLLFFLIVSTMTNPNVIKLLLPESSPSSEIAKNPVSLSITRDLQYYVGNTPVAPVELRERVRHEVEARNNRTLILRVEKGVPVEYLVKALDVGMQLQLKVVLETQRSAGG